MIHVIHTNGERRRLKFKFDFVCQNWMAKRIEFLRKFIAIEIGRHNSTVECSCVGISIHFDHNVRKWNCTYAHHSLYYFKHFIVSKNVTSYVRLRQPHINRVLFAFVFHALSLCSVCLCVWCAGCYEYGDSHLHIFHGKIKIFICRLFCCDNTFLNIYSVVRSSFESEPMRTRIAANKKN